MAGYSVSSFATKDTDLAEALGHRVELVVTAGDDCIAPSFVARACTDAPGSIVASPAGSADAKRVERDPHLDRAAAVVVPGFGLKSATSSRQTSRRWSHVAAGLTDIRQIGPTQTAARPTTASLQLGLLCGQGGEHEMAVDADGSGGRFADGDPSSLQ